MIVEAYDVVSMVDDRHNSRGLVAHDAIKVWYRHEQLFGPGSCLIEFDGIEIDPVEIGWAPAGEGWL